MADLYFSVFYTAFFKFPLLFGFLFVCFTWIVSNLKKEVTVQTRKKKRKMKNDLITNFMY